MLVWISRYRFYFEGDTATYVSKIIFAINLFSTDELINSFIVKVNYLVGKKLYQGVWTVRVSIILIWV